MKYTLLTSLAFVASLTASQAALVAISSVSADSTFNGGVAAANTINNSGMSANAITGTHTQNSNGFQQWHTAVGVTGNTNITFAFGTTVDIGSVYIWNHNQPNVLNRGVNQFDILTSTNGTDFTEVSSDLTLTQSPGGNAISAETFALVATDITHVRFHIDSNYGGNVVGLAEVKFDVVPEPSSTALLGLGGLALILRRRK